MLHRLQRALRVVPPECLWINPDCGLKTRGWAEVTPALRNLVGAAKALRQLAGSPVPAQGERPMLIMRNESRTESKSSAQSAQSNNNSDGLCVELSVT